MRIPVRQIARECAATIRQNGVDAAGDGLVELLWTEVTGGTLDPATGALVGGVEAPRRLRIPALLHFVGASAEERRFAEIQVGDCLVDLLPDAPVDGLTGLRFRINGEEWVPKGVSDMLARKWDTMMGGVRITRTIALRKAT